MTSAPSTTEFQRDLELRILVLLSTFGQQISSRGRSPSWKDECIISLEIEHSPIRVFLHSDGGQVFIGGDWKNWEFEAYDGYRGGVVATDLLDKLEECLIMHRDKLIPKPWLGKKPPWWEFWNHY